MITDVEFLSELTIRQDCRQWKLYLLFFMQEENSEEEDTRYPEDSME